MIITMIITTMIMIIMFIPEFYCESVECPIHLPSPAVRVNSPLCAVHSAKCILCIAQCTVYCNSPQ